MGSQPTPVTGQSAALEEGTARELAAEQLLRRIDSRSDDGDLGVEGVGRLIRVGSRLVIRESTAVPCRSG